MCLIPIFGLKMECHVFSMICPRRTEKRSTFVHAHILGTLLVRDTSLVGRYRMINCRGHLNVVRKGHDVAYFE